MRKLKAWATSAAREPSTYAGLASVVIGLGQIGKISEAPGIADALANVGAAVASGAVDPVSAVLIGLGSLAVAFREKGGKQ
jgi:S-adenosylhomocysteine hydrolase